MPPRRASRPRSRLKAGQHRYVDEVPQIAPDVPEQPDLWQPSEERKDAEIEFLLDDFGFPRATLQNLTHEQFEQQLHKVVSAMPPKVFSNELSNNWPVKSALGLEQLGVYGHPSGIAGMPEYTPLTPEQFEAIIPEIERRIVRWFKAKFTGAPAPASPSVEVPEPRHDEQHLATNENIVVAKDGTLLKAGVRYQSVYAAAPLAKTSATTLRDWIKKDHFLDGPPLETFYFAPTDTHFISEESIERAANRFIKWPSGEPAGAVTLGETDDRSGYIGLPAARDILGISNRTMHLWATERKAPDQQQPDTIKDPISGHLYIREAEVYRLKKLIPKRGLPRGRRPQFQPSAT
jgi:hypothetical protein